jgi:hypothetical protein
MQNVVHCRYQFKYDARSFVIEEISCVLSSFLGGGGLLFGAHVGGTRGRRRSFVGARAAGQAWEPLVQGSSVLRMAEIKSYRR